MRSRSSTTALCALSAASLALGCSSTEDRPLGVNESAATAPTETSAPSATEESNSGSDGVEGEQPESPAIDLDAEAAAAEATLLTLADFPTGWTVVPEEFFDAVPDERAEARRAYVACVGVEGVGMFDFARTTVGRAFTNPAEFATPENDMVTHAVITDELVRVEQFMSDFSADGVDACLAETAREVWESVLEYPHPADNPTGDDVAVDQITVEPLNVPVAGDETVGYRTTVMLSNGGIHYGDTVVTRIGSSVSFLLLESYDLPIGKARTDHLVELAATRLEDATNSDDAS